jgi:ABC-2 type transport system permease protein
MPAIANDITEGDLDKALMKPMNTFFYYLFKDFYILRIIGLLMPIMILIYVIPQVNLDLSIINILKFIILEICMFVFAISNMFFVMTLSFWLGSTEIYQDLFYVIFDISHYPAKSFLGFTKYLFVYAFPIVLMGSIPAMALLGKVSGNEMLIFTLVTLAWALAAYFTWKLGLKSYSSGNSMGGIS